MRTLTSKPYRYGAFFLALLCLSCAHAGVIEAPKDVSKEIDDRRAAFTSGEVYLVSRGRTYIRALNEADVTRGGCRHAYVAREPADVASLVAVLTGAKLTEFPSAKDDYDLRIVVYLYRDRTQRAALLLTQDYDNAHARGHYRNEEPVGRVASQIPVEATQGIEADLRIWAAQHPALLGNCEP